MFQSLFDTLFGCQHRHISFPLTPARTNAGNSFSGAQRKGTTYVTCLDCGQAFTYDWKTMRIGQAVTDRPPAGTTQPSFR